MDEQIISRRISELKNKLTRLNNYISAMEEMNIHEDPERYSLISNDAALQAEHIACQFRNLIFASNSAEKSDYLVKASETHGIEVDCKDGIFSVCLPRLLPKKKTRQSDLFLIDPIHAAIEFYQQKNPVPYYKECVVCIVHMYDRELPEWCILDYDNMQQKHIIDAVAVHIMTDDSGLICDAFNTTEFGDSTCTQVYVMEKDRFPLWLKQRKIRLENT